MPDVELGKYTQITKLAGFEYTKHFDYTTEGDIVALRSLNIRNGKIDLSEMRTMPRSVSDALPRSKLRSGDIVLGYVGSRLGNLAMIEQEDKFHLAPNVAMIRPGTDVAPDYLLQFMLGPVYQARLWALAGSTGQPALSMANIRRSKVWLPPLPEQRKIAEILSTWDRAIETAEALLATARTQKRALMQTLLTGKRRFPEFEGQEWLEVRLDQVARIVKGKQKSKATLSNEGDYPVINGGIGPSGYTDEWNTEAGTITISEGGNSCGYVNLFHHRFWSGGHCYTLESLSIRRDFLFHFLKFQEAKIMGLRVGSGLPNIQKKGVSGVPLTLPTEAEQERIEQVLNAACEEESALAKSVEKLRTEKKALMQQLLTGKRRVKIKEFS